MKSQLLTSKSEHWCTPPKILNLVRKMGTIGLDPCSNLTSLVNAKRSLTPPQDGLSVSWQNQAGLVYVNPPYGRKLGSWVTKIALEGDAGAEIISLTPSRTDTKWFQDGILESANALCFVKGRIKFIDGSVAAASSLAAPSSPDPAPFPSLVSYWGPRVDLFIGIFESIGWCVELR